MNNKSSIFTSGEATSENTDFDVYEWNKKDLSLKKSNILFLFA